MVTNEKGVRMQESMAIMRHFAIAKGYYATEPMQAWAIDACFARYTDWLNASTGPMHFAPEGQKEAGEKFAMMFEKHLADIEAMMEKHKFNWCCSMKAPTMADFGISSIYYRYACNDHEGNIHRDAFKMCFDKHPKIVAMIEKMSESKGFAMHLEKRPKFAN